MAKHHSHPLKSMFVFAIILGLGAATYANRMPITKFLDKQVQELSKRIK